MALSKNLIQYVESYLLSNGVTSRDLQVSWFNMTRKRMSLRDSNKKLYEKAQEAISLYYQQTDDPQKASVSEVLFNLSLN